MRFLRVNDVIAKTGLGRTSIYKLMKEGEFPQSIPLIGKTVAWNEEEVEAWMLEKLEERSNQSM